MDRNDLNLSRRPFANLRPLRRTALALWLAGAALLALNVRDYWGHFSGENKARTRLQQIERELDEERDAVTALRRQVARLSLASLNERSRFVNEKIEQRTFSWSGLFDRLTEALPNDVRLESLTPQFGSGERSRRARQKLDEGEVGLKISGAAKSDEALLELIDSFFEHDSFRAPDLESEEVTDEDLLEFDLQVVYQPDAASEPEADLPGAPAQGQAEAAP